MLLSFLLRFVHDLSDFLQRSELITKVSELKSSNLKLSKNLEEAMDRYELLANKKTDVENQIESLTV